MTILRFGLGDQLTRSLSALADLDPKQDVVLMAEVAEETTYVPHHRQKIALIIALRAEGLKVDCIKLDDPANTGSFTGELLRAAKRHRAGKIVVTEPGEYRVLATMRDWEATLGIPVEIRADDRFFASKERFARWTDGRKSYRMELFYRELRRETGLLMDGDKPVGGQWNSDAENRKPSPRGATLPVRKRFPPMQSPVRSSI